MSYYDFNNERGLRSSFSSATSGPTSITFPITIVCWIYSSASHWADTSTDGIVLMSDAYNDSDHGNSIGLQKGGAADRVRCYASDSQATPTNVILPQLTHSDGTYDLVWMPIVGVFAADNDREIYVGSVGNSSSNATQMTPDNNFTELTVGYLVWNTWNGFIGGGRIAQVGIFTSDWSADTTKVDKFMGGLRADKCDLSNCYAYWPLDSDQATHTDSGPNGGPNLIEVSTILYDTNNPMISQGGTNEGDTGKGILRGVMRGVG